MYCLTYSEHSNICVVIRVFGTGNLASKVLYATDPSCRKAALILDSGDSYVHIDLLFLLLAIGLSRLCAQA